MGNEPVTQNENEAIKCNRMIEKKNNLKSHSLQEFCNKVWILLDYIFTIYAFTFYYIIFSFYRSKGWKIME